MVRSRFTLFCALLKRKKIPKLLTKQTILNDKNYHGQKMSATEKPLNAQDIQTVLIHAVYK